MTMITVPISDGSGWLDRYSLVQSADGGQRTVDVWRPPAYDAGGRRTRATDQSGFSVNYSYDAVGRLAQLTDGSGQPLVTYEYNVAGRLRLESHGNGTSTTYAYDEANQLLHLVNFAPDGTTIQSRFDYTYDDNGRRTSMATLEGTTEYVYDADGRLIQATLPGGRVLTYVYDAAGNRTTSSDNGATTAYTVNDMNQYLAVGGTSQSYDADGNLVSSSGPSGPRSSSYDAEGQLTSVVTAQGTWTYEYDALGRLKTNCFAGEICLLEFYVLEWPRLGFL
jgi:YD repeat-containing protein